MPAIIRADDVCYDSGLQMAKFASENRLRCINFFPYQ
jgi:hypothetical protein